MKSPFTKIKLPLTVFCLLFILSVYGKSIFDLPTPKKFVNDYAELLSEYQESELEKKVIAYNKSSSTQIAVVTVKDLEELEPAVFAQKLAEQWGVGQKYKDNGVLILVKPKYHHEKGQVFIAVGYGLEHLIPDVKAKRIVNNILLPNFKKNRIYKGLNESIDSIIQLSSGEFINDKKSVFHVDNFIGWLIFLGILFLLMPILYLTYARNRKVPEKYAHYYIKGAYNSKNLIEQIELIETKFDKKFPKFKNLIKRYELLSRNNLIKYAGKIDRQLFCYLLDGRKRWKLFWQLADPILKIMFFYILLIFLVTCWFLFYYSGLAALFLGLVLSLIIIYGLFGFLISFLEIFQFVLRKNSKYLGGISIALFALNSIFKRSVKRKFNAVTGRYTYYPHVIYYSSGSGGGGFGGGFSGGGGGFGGGGFGGGGAGGSW